MGVEDSYELVVLAKLDKTFEVALGAFLPFAACRQLYAYGIAANTFGGRDDTVFVASLPRPGIIASAHYEFIAVRVEQLGAGGMEPLGSYRAGDCGHEQQKKTEDFFHGKISF